MNYTAITHIHNSACEKAAQANCHCSCRGAGHQNDLVVRAATCSNTDDLASLVDNLEKIFGGFHKNFRDAVTQTRGARAIPKAAQLAALDLSKRSGATWCETLLVDEVLHAVFIDVANASLRLGDAVRDAQREFVCELTKGAIPIVESSVTLSNVIESHVWCSIVAEQLASTAPSNPLEPLPRSFADICYPRKSKGMEPSSLAGVRTQGLQHLKVEYAAAQAIPHPQRIALLRLVGAATCPDLWRHAAAVRFCLLPFVSEPKWAPANTTVIGTHDEFGRLQRAWQRKGHW